MRTAINLATFLHGNTDGGTRIARAAKWIRYYARLRPILKFEQIFIFDNGGTDEQISELERIWGPVDFPIHVTRNAYIPRGAGLDCLPCWRGNYSYGRIMDQGFEKIIVSDDDAFLVSKRLIEHVANLKTGWECFWCACHKFPENGLMVLCADAFYRYREFTQIPYEKRNNTGVICETQMPYTHINKSFNTNRWGEWRAPQTPGMDGYFQCPTDLELTPEI